MVTRLGLYGGPRGPYGSFAGKAPGSDLALSGVVTIDFAVSGDIGSHATLAGATGFTFTPSGNLSTSSGTQLALAGSTGFTWTPSGDLDVRATLDGASGFTWTPSGNLATDAIADIIVSEGVVVRFDLNDGVEAKFTLNQSIRVKF